MSRLLRRDLNTQPLRREVLTVTTGPESYVLCYWCLENPFRPNLQKKLFPSLYLFLPSWRFVIYSLIFFVVANTKFFLYLKGKLLPKT